MSATTGWRAAIAVARRDAFAEAKGGNRWVWSRGAYLATLDARGEQCAPSPGADAQPWDGRLSTIAAFIARVSVEHPHVERIVVEGGYDGGDTMADRRDGTYEPWVASWTVEVWRRGA